MSPEDLASAAPNSPQPPSPTPATAQGGAAAPASGTVPGSPAAPPVVPLIVPGPGTAATPTGPTVTPTGSLKVRVQGFFATAYRNLVDQDYRASLEDRFLDFLVSTLVRVRKMTGRVNAALPQIITFLALPISITQLYLRTRCNYLAAAIAFNVMLSLIPYLLVAAAILGYVVSGNAEIGKHLSRYVEINFPPYKDSLTSMIDGVSSVKSQLGFVGMLTLFWTSRQMVFAASFALDTIHGRPGEKAMWRKLLDTLIVICLATLLITGGVFFSVVLGWVSRITDLHLDEGAWLKTFSFPFAFVVSTVIFLAFYQILPQQRPSWMHSLIGAGVGAILWELSKLGLVGYFPWAFKNEFYGPLAVGLYVILWAYLFATGMLVGACTAWRLDAEKKRTSYVAE